MATAFLLAIVFLQSLPAVMLEAEPQAGKQTAQADTIKSPTPLRCNEGHPFDRADALQYSIDENVDENVDDGIDDWLDELIDKICLVESGGRIDTTAGDNGEAIGPLQIHRCVIDDVNLFYGTDYRHEDAKSLDTARQIAKLYISMWFEKHREEIAARIFNGGPRGWEKEATKKYWIRIQNTEVRKQNMQNNSEKNLR